MKCFLLTAASLVLAAGAAAGTPVVDVLYTRAALSPSSNVPGAVDLSGTPVSTKFNSMLEFWLSPDGTKFLLRGATTQPTAESDNMLLLGSGLTGSVHLQEGRPFPGAVGAEVVDFVSSLNPQPFNSLNGWVFPVRARGGVASVFNKIIRFDAAGVGTLRFQMGDLYTGLTDISTAVSGDETLGNSQASAHLLNDGRIGWQDNSVGNLSSTRRPIAAYDAVKHLQSRLDMVTAIDGVTPILLTNIGSTGTLSVFITSPDGSTTVIRGAVDVDANGSNTPADPDMVMVNNVVRIQVGQVIPTQTITPTTISQTSVAGNNDWYARGNSAGGAWATRNGVVIAATGGSIGTDTWGSTFYAIAGSTSGSWAIAGKSATADPATDDVLVLDGQVILREGDPVSVDIDGDGTMDTAFIGRGNNTLAAFVANSSLGVAPDGKVYILANLHDADSLDLAPSGTPTALIRITPPSDCIADFNNSGSVTVQDIFDFLGAYFNNDPSADINGAGGITVQDIFDFLNLYFLGC